MSPILNTRLMLGAFFSIFLIGTATRSATIRPEYAERILPVSQVKSGMRGYGLTVFHGTKIDRFDVKVEGVLPNVNSGRPLILVRVGGGQLNRRAINIAEGMSGSPVYIGNKIIGAVAYAGNFAVEPLGLVTPIEDMLEAWSSNLSAAPPGTGEIQPLPQPIKIGTKVMSSIGIAISPDQKAPTIDPTLGWFRPMSTPLIASGLSSKTLAQATDKLSIFPISLRSGPGRMVGKPISFSEGSAVGFSLTTGDIEMTAIGTVTFVDKGRLLAFGHPFLAMGPIEMPMSTVWVHDIFPSYEVSYKLASPVSVVGTSVQDRPFCVSGLVGKQAQMVPITINLKDATNKTNRAFNVRVLNHPLLTPILAQLATIEALQRFRPYPGEGMARVTMTAVAKDVGVVQKTNMFFSPVDITGEAMGDIGDFLNLLRDNKFHPVALAGLTVDVQLFQTRQTVDIERMTIDKTTYEPGQTVNVSIQMRPYNKVPVIKTMQVTIPKDSLDGKAILIVQSGGTAAQGQIATPVPGIPILLRSGMPDDVRDAGSLQQMLERFSQLNRNDQIVARIQLPSASFAIEGQKLIGLPPSMENVIQSSKSTPVRMVRDEVKVAEGLPYFVTGMQMISFNVKARNYSEKPASTSTSAGAENDATPSATTSPSTTSVVSVILGESEASAVVDKNFSTRAADAEGNPEEDGDSPDSSDSSGDVSDSAAYVVAPDDSSEDETSQSKTETKDKKDKDIKSSGRSDATKKVSVDTASPNLSDIGRSTKIWQQTTPEDFLKGRTEQAAVDSQGALTLGKKLSRLASLDDAYVWSVCITSDGSIIAGSGNKGHVWKVNDGKARVLFSVSGPEVSAVACDRSGRIWAASSPDGVIWLYDNEQARKLLTLPIRHVGALLIHDDVVYAAAGDGGTIWKLSVDGQFSIVANTAQKHIECLAFAPNGELYAGSAGVGAVWRIGDKGSDAVLKVNEEYINAIAFDKSGVIYAASGPRGKVYQIKPGESPKVVINKLSSQSTPIITARDGGILVVDGDTLYTLYPDGRKLTQSVDSAPEIYALCHGTGDEIVAGTANTGSIWKLAPADHGSFESSVRDAERPAIWGKLTAIPDVSSIQIRSGNTQSPDSTWSAWRNVSSGNSVDVSSTRYLQYRVSLTTAQQATSKLEEIAVRYLPVNQSPTVKISAPKAGAAISGTQKVSWSGTDPDGDKLVYVLSCSADDGKTWIPIDKTTKTNSLTDESKQTKEPTATPADSNTSASQAKAILDSSATTSTLSSGDQELKDKLDKHTEIPAELKKQILSSSDSFKRNFIADLENDPAKSDKSDGANSVTSTSHSWDTGKLADGYYRLKVEASDKLANGPKALKASAEIGPIYVANSKPSVQIYSSASKSRDGNYQVSGNATSKGVPIATVQYRIDGKGEWAVAQPDDGIYDDLSESYTLESSDLRTGKHDIEVKVKDIAGNSTITKKTIEIKAEQSKP